MNESVQLEFNRAVGLSYQAGRDDCPKISVKGELRYADQLVKVARRFGVPVVENAALADALSGLELDEPISVELYQAVAVVLSKL